MIDPPEIPYRNWIKQNGMFAARELSHREPESSFLDEVLDMYESPSRHYHNLDHIGSMTIVMKSGRPKCVRPNEMELAILFHDAIYDPHAKDNEEQSADLAVRTLNPLGVPQSSLKVIEELILCTKAHVPTENPDSAMIIDADLAILGSSIQAYIEYFQRIRKEYAFVEEQDYRIGRTRVLQSLLNRESIFNLPWFKERFETQARANIAREIFEINNAHFRNGD